MEPMEHCLEKQGLKQGLTRSQSRRKHLHAEEAGHQQTKLRPETRKLRQSSEKPRTEEVAEQLDLEGGVPVEVPAVVPAGVDLEVQPRDEVPDPRDPQGED
mmetsp:Transcript_68540/g.107892  ORF Transcript_68540/g.107892 Transcript_68540/m.107892 type:complete len:101 (-) Transcript_68540:1142-1444(-)